jgi:hypothetical protein
MAVPLIVCEPCVVVVTGEGQVAIPESASEQVKLTVALGPKIIPFAFGAGETVALITGGVSSIFSVIEVLPLKPATSVTVPEAVWFAPSVLTVCGCGQLVTGEADGVHWNVTVTGVLFQPAALAAGAAVAVMLGGAVSRFTTTVAVAVLPAISVAVPEIFWFAP